ncbi:rhomboid family intramembrane serine protease [Gracilimonas mengyeensis]|uniref:Membrane associated serine protease, rhomboid family n=1 Tax=Gracilimonas mengyeensis TaxID=1302730 RepID=A0A521DVL4_9BACT|nr:rhomboid family intramembrane serine protease [Gracilimonas mengyeensis]SMO75685.1 Membrane associated serine protease, rhomboid family [Gracilimonas mengyeensis]
MNNSYFQGGGRMRDNMPYDSFGGALKRGFMGMPVAIRTIILINAVVFVIQMLGGQTLNGWLVPTLGFDPSFPTFLTQPWRLVTYMFLHGGFLHFLFNMLWLWWMGRSVEETLGPRTFTVIYFGAGILGAVLDAAIAMVFGSALVIGASGAVTGILVAFAMLFPTAPIMLFLFPPIQARFFVAGWIAIDILFLGSGDGVARLVHLGGALGGYLLIKAHQDGKDLSLPVRYLEYLFGRMKSSTSSKSSSKKRPRNKNMSIVQDAEIVEEIDQDELDAILEKISKKGYDSLTKEEKRKLFELSKKQ